MFLFSFKKKDLRRVGGESEGACALPFGRILDGMLPSLWPVALLLGWLPDERGRRPLTIASSSLRCGVCGTPTII